ncbi:hypothetical protein Runsl_3097 [Runella slithyformis DSM 19594]|uniref:Uncharacterized protein n=1 Tax=Runella slithyformis (strain ATCC 29530 / DSM 19594 / LMG 11500 / NCIMB 11436 / LSU 4) TaxID=761193 RepID=A0A7U3ZLM5_RUNSL|nr:hypothetical protein Runsl_3097 [Runella slithyformis DSM 19594]
MQTVLSSKYNKPFMILKADLVLFLNTKFGVLLLEVKTLSK